MKLRKICSYKPKNKSNEIKIEEIRDLCDTATPETAVPPFETKGDHHVGRMLQTVPWKKYKLRMKALKKDNKVLKDPERIGARIQQNDEEMVSFREARIRGRPEGAVTDSADSE